MARRKKDPAIDPLTTQIKVIASKSCPTLSGKETLEYKLGRHPDGSLHLRVSSSTGTGYWNQHWVPTQALCDLVQENQTETGMASTVLRPLFRKMSTNSVAFFAAVLRSEGALVPYKIGSRLHTVGDLDAFLQQATSATPKRKTATQRKPRATAKRSSRSKAKASPAK